LLNWQPSQEEFFARRPSKAKTQGEAMAHDAHHGEGHAHAHWDTSVWPFVISFGILFLAVAFSFISSITAASPQSFPWGSRFR
jgi:hypothetical protein